MPRCVFLSPEAKAEATPRSGMRSLTLASQKSAPPKFQKWKIERFPSTVVRQDLFSKKNYPGNQAMEYHFFLNQETSRWFWRHMCLDFLRIPVFNFLFSP